MACPFHSQGSSLPEMGTSLASPASFGAGRDAGVTEHLAGAGISQLRVKEVKTSEGKGKSSSLDAPLFLIVQWCSGDGAGRGKYSRVLTRNCLQSTFQPLSKYPRALGFTSD